MTGKNLLALLALHVWLAGFVYGLAGTLWGTLAEKGYEARMRPGLRKWLMPGRLADKAYWIRYQKIVAAVALPLVLVIYAAALVQLLR